MPRTFWFHVMSSATAVVIAGSILQEHHLWEAKSVAVTSQSDSECEAAYSYSYSASDRFVEFYLKKPVGAKYTCATC